MSTIVLRLCGPLNPVTQKIKLSIQMLQKNHMQQNYMLIVSLFWSNYKQFFAKVIKVLTGCTCFVAFRGD